jgi:hypothetical protein
MAITEKRVKEAATRLSSSNAYSAFTLRAAAPHAVAVVRKPSPFITSKLWNSVHLTGLSGVCWLL